MATATKRDEICENISCFPVTVEFLERDIVVNMEYIVSITANTAEITIPNQGFLALFFPIFAVIGLIATIPAWMVWPNVILRQPLAVAFMAAKSFICRLLATSFALGTL